MSGSTDNNYVNIKRVEDSLTESSHLLFPSDMNSYGRLFGGRLLQWMDETAGLVAKRHSESVVVTAAIDQLQFREGASETDVIFMRGYLTWTGRTSMEVRIDTFAEKNNGMRVLINTAYFVMVAVDSAGHPIPVPGLRIETLNQQIEWESGQKRQELRKRRKKEGY